MAMPSEMDSVDLGEPQSRAELVLEMIALRHQIAVLKRSRTRRPCFGLWDRLLWFQANSQDLLSRCPAATAAALTFAIPGASRLVS